VKPQSLEASKKNKKKLEKLK